MRSLKIKEKLIFLKKKKRKSLTATKIIEDLSFGMLSSPLLSTFRKKIPAMEVRIDEIIQYSNPILMN